MAQDPKTQWVVYLVGCSDGSLYCGVTNDLERRLAAHNSGKGARYTRSRTPVKLVCASSPMTKSEAHRLEYRVKRAPAAMKKAMIRPNGKAGADPEDGTGSRRE